MGNCYEIDLDNIDFLGFVSTIVIKTNMKQYKSTIRYIINLLIERFSNLDIIEETYDDIIEIYINACNDETYREVFKFINRFIVRN